MELKGGRYCECRGYAASKSLNFAANDVCVCKSVSGLQGWGYGFFGKRWTGGSRLLKETSMLSLAALSNLRR